MQPYSGIRVLDISQGIAGPYCAQILAAQGAEVIKVEPPSGDWGRFVGYTKGDQSALSIQYNQGKRGVALDARTDEGRALLKDLVAQCQVLIQNFRPGVAERLGIDYVSLAKTQKDIVCVSITGYGPTGPAANLPASDSVLQADSGLMHANRTQAGEPKRIGMLLADSVTGLYAAQALSAALYQRLLTGQGSHIQTSLFQACVALQGMNLVDYALAGDRPAEAVSAPNGVFSTADGQMTVLTLNDDQFGRLCRAIEAPEWLTDVRFSSNASRMAHRDVLHESLTQLMQEKNTAYWVEAFTKHEVLHAIVRDYAGLLTHPQAAVLGLFKPTMQPGVGEFPSIPFPAAVFSSQLSVSPSIGQDTVSVLQSLGIESSRIESLLANGVLVQSEVKP
jgi:crotonobetainyl-CoA:carnitine CoA-transferase CaiB-like acyl-CoA transferase